MNFDINDIKGIIVSVAASVVFALLVYFFHDYWKEKKNKKLEKLQLEREEEEARMQLQLVNNEIKEAQKLFENKFYKKALEKCQSIIGKFGYVEFPAQYWVTKKLQGNCYFELRTTEAYEENCLHSPDAFFSCIEISKTWKDDEANGLLHVDIGKSFASLAIIRSKEKNLSKAIEHLIRLFISITALMQAR